MLHSRSVRQERSFWRDTSLNLRHRQWGWDCPATDIDFLEYDRGRSIALCEWKHERAAPYDSNDASMRARRDLADKAKVPFFVIIRANDLSWLDIVPENKKAEEIMIRAGIQDKPYRFESEIKFVDFLYWLRGRPLPKDVVNTITTNKFVNRRPLDDLRDVWARADYAERMAFTNEILGGTP